jgi:tRNA 2-thiouridine synthesizing protein A
MIQYSGHLDFMQVGDYWIPAFAGMTVVAHRKGRVWRCPLTMRVAFAMYGRMATTKLDLTGLKCPLPALKTRKALKALTPGAILEVHCTDPLSVIDIPNLIQETGDKVEITEHAERRFVFLIEKAGAGT